MILDIREQKHVTTAQIRRPEARNAVNFQMMDELENLLDNLEKSSDTRLFVLTGSDGSFISGGDLREFHRLKKANEAKRMTKRMMEILDRIEQLPFWTLASVNGYAYGGGWETMLAFDFRIAVDSVKIGFTQGKFYLPPGWGGINRLSNLVGHQQSTYWLAAQKVITAKEGYQHGLLHEVAPKEEFEDLQKSLIDKLILNDRTFINYLKSSRSHKTTGDEVEPFSEFWESSEHLRRVDTFLNRKK